MFHNFMIFLFHGFFQSEGTGKIYFQRKYINVCCLKQNIVTIVNQILQFLFLYNINYTIIIMYVFHLKS